MRQKFSEIYKSIPSEIKTADKTRDECVWVRSLETSQTSEFCCVVFSPKGLELEQCCGNLQEQRHKQALLFATFPGKKISSNTEVVNLLLACLSFLLLAIFEFPILSKYYPTPRDCNLWKQLCVDRRVNFWKNNSSRAMKIRYGSTKI